MNSANSSLIPSLIPLSNTKTQYMEDIFLSKRCRSEASSVSDYSDTFTDPSSLYEPSFRSNDSLFSDGGCSTSGYCTPVSVKDENAYVCIKTFYRFSNRRINILVFFVNCLVV